MTKKIKRTILKIAQGIRTQSNCKYQTKIIEMKILQKFLETVDPLDLLNEQNKECFQDYND